MPENAMLKAVDLNIWVAEQPLKYFGLSIRTRMTIVRLNNNDLAIISPIQISQSIIQQLDQIGKVQHIIAPNLYHYLFAADFKQHYPKSIFWATPGLKEKEPDLPIDKILEAGQIPFLSQLNALFFDGFRTLVPSGAESLNEFVFLHPQTRTLILTDAAFNFDETFPLTTQIAARIGGAYKTLSPSWLEKMAISEKEKVKASVESVLKWDFDRVIMAHGAIVEAGGKQAFSDAYRFLR